MSNNSVFNAAVCIMGILILTIHVINLLVKKEKRKDEYSLINFFLFTIFHFATYLTFTIVKLYYTSNAYIIAFYTIFYIMNNMELFLLFRYMQHYVELEPKLNKILTIVNICLFGIFVILDFVNIGTGIFFTANNGEYLRSSTMIISQGYQFIMFTVVFFVTILNKKLKIYEKIAFAVYCLLPVIAIVLQNIFKGYAIAYLSIIIAIEVLFLFSNVQRNMELSKQKQQNAEAQIKLMLSQIQPHFIYNSLSSISTLITIDPDKAQNALDDFNAFNKFEHNYSWDEMFEIDKNIEVGVWHFTRYIPYVGEDWVNLYIVYNTGYGNYSKDAPYWIYNDNSQRWEVHDAAWYYRNSKYPPKENSFLSDLVGFAPTKRFSTYLNMYIELFA